MAWTQKRHHTDIKKVTGQRPQLRSQVPTNSLEPVGQWVWGKLINGFVYRAKSSYGGASGKFAM